MATELIYTNDFFILTLDGHEVFINMIDEGYHIQNFNEEVLKSCPRIKITKYTALNTALTNKNASLVLIGEMSEEVEVTISNDQLSAYVMFNMTLAQFNRADKKKLLSRMMQLIEMKKIVFGLQIEDVVKEMKPMEKILIAKGEGPIKGKDAILNPYMIEEPKPSIVESGGVDHYELNIINKILEGDWLGERIEPTKGILGKSVLGKDLRAEDGAQENLKFDKNSVGSEFDPQLGVTRLYAKRNGAAVYLAGDVISVLNSISMDGTIGLSTGNIDFDGFVEISNSVEDGFSVTAQENIQIMGEMGIGAVELIESKQGDIFIKGGIAGRNAAVIRAKKNVYTKFAADCIIECEGTVNIGFYAMNCVIRAKEIIFESTNSKIIGGKIEADIKVIVGEIGSRASIYTQVRIMGFDREKLQADYNLLGSAIEATKSKIEDTKRKLETFEAKEIRVDQRAVYDKLRLDYQDMKRKLAQLYEMQKNYVSYLHTKGSGEVRVKKGIYANTNICIKDAVFTVHEDYKSPRSFYYLGDQMKMEP